MEPLSATDLHTVLDVARELGEVRDLEGLHAGVLPQLRRLVPYDTASFNEIAPSAGEAVVTVVEPTDAIFDGAEEIFGAYAHQNPLIAAAQRPGDTAVRKFSDFISRRQLHRLDLYELVYATIEVEHQIAFTLPAPSAHVIGLALNRKRGDFSERDRNVLQAIRPFVVQAYIDAAARARARAAVAALEWATDSTAHAVIVLGRGGRIELATDLAIRWLGGVAPADVGIRLPEPLRAWSAAQRRRARQGRHHGQPLELCAGEATLTAQFIPGGADRLDAILLRQRAPLRTGAMLALGLTNREIEVLRLLAHGLSNGQIALELALSERTIAKHLEHVYAKLDVGNRTAAVARARDVSTRAGRN
jgi:DNA-binding CsgD family transcriptional regulator